MKLHKSLLALTLALVLVFTAVPMALAYDGTVGVTLNLSGLTNNGTPTSLTANESLAISLTADSGYSLPTTVTVTNTTQSTYTLTSGSVTIPAAEITAGAVTVTAAGVAQDQTITITGDGYTGTTSATAKTDSSYNAPSYTGTAPDNKEFSHWVASNGLTGDYNEGASITVPFGGFTLTAAFKDIEHTVTINLTNCTTDGFTTQKVVHGNNITDVTIAADTGYTLEGATVSSGATLAADGKLSLNGPVTANVTINVTAKALSSDVTVTGTAGQYTFTGASTATTGKTYTATISPKSGYQVTSVAVSGSSAIGSFNADTGKLTVTGHTGPFTITVTTTASQYFELKYQDSTGADLRTAESREEKVSSKLTLVTKDSYYVSEWEVSASTDSKIAAGAKFKYDDKITLTDGNVTLKAIAWKARNPIEGNPGVKPVPPIFEYHWIEATTSKGGTISNSGWTKVERKDDITYYFEPNSGYYIKAVYVDGYKVDTVNARYTFENVREDHKIHVEFVKKSGNYDDVPQTGDQAPIALALTLFTGSMLALAFVTLRKRENN